MKKIRYDRLIILLLLLVVIVFGVYFSLKSLGFKNDDSSNIYSNIKKNNSVSNTQVNDEDENKNEKEEFTEEFYDNPVGDIVGVTSKGYEIKYIDGAYYIKDMIIVNKRYGISKDYAPGGLVTEFMNAWNVMKADASKEGLNIFVKSGYRSYLDQSIIYNGYVKTDGKEKADTYSARPGHSEHQTGYAADLNGNYGDFENTAEGKWINQNCYKYGFIIRYPKSKTDITGYIYESWHIRYVGKDVSNVLYNDGDWITLEEYLGITSEYMD